MRGQPVPFRFCGNTDKKGHLFVKMSSSGTLLECSVGSYSSRLLLGCGVLDEFDRDSIAQRMPARPNVWTDGSLVPD